MLFLARLFAFVFAILAILFAAANPGDLTVRLWPLPYVGTLPVYAAVLGPAFLGFVAGALAVWPALHRLRRKVRHEAKTIAALEKEAARLREPTPPPSPRSFFQRLLPGRKA